MNAISISDKQAKMLLILIAILLAAGAFLHFYNKAQKKQQLAAAEPETPGRAEQRIHQHIAHVGQALATGMMNMEQSINGRLDEVEYNTRPKLIAAADDTKREPVGFKPSYMTQQDGEA